VRRMLSGAGSGIPGGPWKRSEAPRGQCASNGNTSHDIWVACLPDFVFVREAATGAQSGNSGMSRTAKRPGRGFADNREWRVCAPAALEPPNAQYAYFAARERKLTSLQRYPVAQNCRKRQRRLVRNVHRACSPMCANGRLLTIAEPRRLRRRQHQTPLRPRWMRPSRRG
jgi:hypothetical protein